MHPNKYFLQGSYEKYHSALESGVGYLFKIKVPESMLQKKITIDTVYFNEVAVPFTLRKNKHTYIEFNIYYPEKSPSLGDSLVEEQKIKNPLAVSTIHSRLIISQHKKRYTLKVSGYQLKDSPINY